MPSAYAGEQRPAGGANTAWQNSQNWRYPRDPLVLDLDADGIETVGLNSGTHFDHNADNIATGTGWLKSDDAFLVRDLNGNGTIDTGRELFGDNTALPNGQLAANGYAALAALDTNADGFIDAADTAFAELKLWQDHNQDGISQANELKTLSEAGILNLGVSGALKNQNLGNGNVLAREGFFVRTDGSTGTAGELNLAIDTFNTRFTDSIPVTEPVKALPNMSGSGKVRELWQAASQSGALAGLLAQFAAATTREAQMALLDPILGAWADTSGMTATLDDRDPAHYRIEYVAFGSLRRSDHLNKTALDGGTSSGGNEVVQGSLRNIDDPRLDATYKAAIQNWNRKLHILEAFNGQYFFNLPSEKNETPGANVGMRKLDAGSTPYYQLSGDMLGQVRQTLAIEFAQPQLNLLDEALAALKDSVYGALVLQTRVKPLLDLVELIIDEQGIRLDATALSAEIANRIAADPIHGLSDLLDLDRYAADLLTGSNWDGMAGFDSLIKRLPQTPELSALLNDYKVRQLGAGNDWNYNGSDNDIVMGGAGNDTHYGNNGNDRLYGEEGDDRIYGGGGSDLISGGAGNDVLAGESGADTYIFGRGYGNDTISDYAENGVQRDTVRLLGLTPADIRVTADYNDNLVFTIVDTGETLSVPRGGYWWGTNGVGQYVFDPSTGSGQAGTIWTHDDALRATVAATTENDDVIHGSSVGDTISGQAGNDTLIGHAGDDVIDGGAGNDSLIGSTGWNWIYENGSYRVERNTTPQISASGNDTYLFGRGDGQDTVIDGDYTTGNTDTLRFKEGVAPADVKLIRSGNDLVLAIRGSSDQVTLKQYFDEAWNGASSHHLIERIAFADGTVLSFANVQAILFAGSEEAETIVGSRTADVLTGQGGNDVLLGGAGRDILDGGSGNDVLRGGGVIGWNNQIYDGDGAGDTYRFGRGDGHDTIIEESWMAGETDRVELKAGVLPADVFLTRVRTVNGWLASEDLMITIRDTGETLTVKNHFNESNRYAVEEIAFADGTRWNTEMIKSRSLLGEAGDDELRGFNERDDLIEGGAGNDNLIGLSGNDTLVGGTGDDVLEGGAGSDTYRFGLGDAQDAIYEGYTSGVDTVQLASGVTPLDVTVRWTLQGDMAVTLPDGSKLTVRGQADTWSTERGIEQLRFADGTVWNRADLASRALAATHGDDAIVGGNLDDTLDGGSGNDQFQDLSGYDTYRFGTGDGQDSIADIYGRVLFKPGIGQNDIAFTRDGNDLIATVTASGDAVRVKDWLNSWQRIDRFDFDNGARLNVSDVLAKLNVSEGAEILYGSPSEDTLSGTEKDSTLYGREGNDVLSGGAGYDQLFGEAGDDMLAGGADRDWLYGGEGNNSYRVTTSMGLDNAIGASLAVASDAVLFAPGIRPEDVSVQLGDGGWISQAGDVGYYNLVIGIGGNDALVLRNQDGNDLGRGALQLFRFDDGTEWTLADVVARADGGKMGWQQRYWGDSTNILGSQVDDDIDDYTGQSVTVQARGNDDNVHLEAGNDRISAGSGDDDVSSGAGEDLVAGEAGNDNLNTGADDDVVVFNHGDGNDSLRTDDGTDVLSFGATVTPTMLSAALNRNGRVVLLVDAGAGGSITLDNTHINDLPGDLERIQFVDADGKARVFDLAGWLQANAGPLLSATTATPLVFDGTGFELTGTVAPAGGLEAIAYAQSGDLFASANLENNIPTDGDDVLYGTPNGDTLNAGAGNDIALGLAGNDTIFGGDGNDLIHGGDGVDVLEGNAGDDVIYGGWGSDQLTGGIGNDQLFGEWGGDTYVYQPGHGEVTIDDDHHVLNWGYGGGEGGYGGEWDGGEGGYGGGWDGGEGGYGGSIIDDAPNILTFGTGIRPEDLRYSEQNGDLVIEFANQPGDRVILRGFEPNRATQTRSVDIIRFADGTEIVAENIEPTGKTETASDDGGWLDGTQFADTLIGGDGNDTLNGQGGADRLVGGTGSDTYRIRREWDARPTETLIAETWREQDTNRIEITGEISAGDLRLEFDGRDLLLRLTEDGDVIRFAGFDPRAEGMQAPVSQISLPWQGVSLSFDDLLSRGVRIIGTPDDDLLTGTALADWIEGREADDTMSGGIGGDLYLIDADAGSDTIIDSENGDAPNTLVLPEGTTLDDVRLSYDAEGFLILDLANTDNRVRLSGFDPQNPLGPRAVERFRFGLEGDEIGYEELLARGFDIVGTDESDALKGTTLTDRVRGGDGNDLIEATPGGDRLTGEGGNDTYVVKLGDGIVTIDDLAEQYAGNVLRFGPGISTDDLRMNLRFEQRGNGAVLILPFGNDGDEVHLLNFNPENVLNTRAVDRFEFADGTVVDYATLVSWTFVVEGNNSGNELSGTNVADRLYGYDGDDLLVAGDGNDVLTGGAGFDELEGGNGRDAYVFNLGDGVDDIYDVIDEGVGNIVTFGPGIAREDIVLEFDGDALLVRYGNGGDSFYVADFAPEGAEGPTVIDTFEFADGSSVSLRELLNVAPEVAGSVGDQTAIEDASFVLQLPDGLFVDGNGDAISEWISVSGYERFPSWLNYDAATRTLYGVPDNDAVGSFDVTVQGMDGFGASAFHSFRVEVLNTNDAPDVAAPLVDGLATEDAAFTYIVPAGSFADVDAGDSLTISAASANGDPLPAWLTFDPVTRTFSGVPVNADVGVYSLRVTATDLAGEQVSQLFAVTVANTNDAPTVSVALADVLATEDVPFSHALPADAFADEDLGDQLTFSAAQEGGAALPDWLVFDPATGTFSGTPGNDHVGVLRIRITAADLSGSTAHQVFSIGVANVNDAPEALHDIGAHAAVQGQAFSYALPADAFGDVDVGDSLRYDATLANGDPLPAWLSFDADAGAFSGMPANGDVGLVQIRVTATDLAGASAQQTFALSIVNVNDAPVVADAPADQQAMEDAMFVYALPAGTFDDIDAGDVLSFQASLANGEALPSWLSFDAATATFRGTPGNGDVGQISLRVVATDMAGATATASFSLAVGNVNDGPVVGTPLSDSGATEDHAFNYTIPTDAFSDIDAGDLLGYSATLANGDALPDWLSFDAASGTFSGTPGNGDVGRVDVRVTATDLAGASASQTFALSVENVNDAPLTGGDSLSGNEDASLSIASATLLANDHDIDPTNDILAISAVGEARNGTVVLGANGEVMFTPDADFNGEAGFSYTVADGHGGFSNGQVSIAVGAVNDAPVAAQALADQSVRNGTAFTYALPQNAFTDIDAGDRLAYAATLADGGVLPAWLAFDAASGTFSGTPCGGTTSLRIQVSATDLAGASASQSFGLDVTGGNAIPVANPDSASVSEDCKLWACGNVLANDSDADAGTRLRVGDPGIRRGTYGTLTLLGNGSYSYVLDNCSAQVQGLGAGEQVVDRFGYKASDGTDFAVGELAVTVSGANDKPWLAKSLADRTLAKDSDFRWQIPAGSFADRDRNDTLTYSARLTNGSALPSWLKFDAVTQTFSGRTPANAKGNVEVVVSAKDGHGECSVAADTFKISFGSGGGCGKGNEGVGNGEDPPPPGHGDNHNDGPGSGPGNPGRRGDRHDDDRPHGAGDRNHDDDWTKGWGQGGKGKDFAYLDLGLIERYRNPCDDESRAGHGREGRDFEHRWAEMDRTLNRMLIESERAGLGHDGGHSLDPRAVHGLAHGGTTTMRGGIDPVSLTAGAGASLKGFHGLQEGIQRLG